MKPLTIKQQRFVDAYLGATNGVGHTAAKMAGYRQGQNALYVPASENRRLPNIRAAMARDKELEVRDRIRAIDELNKCSGRHSVQHLHEGRLTLEPVLGDSRK